MITTVFPSQDFNAIKHGPQSWNNKENLRTLVPHTVYCLHPAEITLKGWRFLEEFKAQKQSAGPRWDVSIFNHGARTHARPRSHTHTPHYATRI